MILNLSNNIAKGASVYDQINQLQTQIDANNQIISNNTNIASNNGQSINSSNSQQKINDLCNYMKTLTGYCIQAYYSGTLTIADFGCDSDGNLSSNALAILADCQGGSGTTCARGYCFLRSYYDTFSPQILVPALAIKNALTSNNILQRQISSITPREHLEKCILNILDSVALDNSNCKEGMICESILSVCTLTTETICLSDGRGGGCVVGQKCAINGDSQIIQDNNQIGICVIEIKNGIESNPLEQIICNVYKLITGKVGRGILVIVIFALGIQFYLSKISWATMTAIIVGTGLSFGGAQITSVFLGKEFICR